MKFDVLYIVTFLFGSLRRAKRQFLCSLNCLSQFTRDGVLDGNNRPVSLVTDAVATSNHVYYATFIFCAAISQWCFQPQSFVKKMTDISGSAEISTYQFSHYVSNYLLYCILWEKIGEISKHLYFQMSDL